MKIGLEDNLNIETLEYFETYLLDNLKKNKLTVNNIIRTVKEFIAYLEENSLKIEAKTIRRYLGLIQDSLRESSFITKVSAIRQFTNWLNIKNNPFLDKDFIFNRTEIDFLTDDEFNSLFNNDESFNYQEMILRTFYELHLSLSELGNIRLKDFNQANASFKVRNKKIKCTDRLAALCKDYLKTYREQIANHAFYSPQINEHFFIRDDNFKKETQSLTNIQLSEIIQSYKISLNKLKRSRIINLIKSGATDSDIENMLGITISNFYDQFKPKQDYRLLNAYANFHPRSKKK
jgi:site-specific recombinase XerD